MSETILSKIGNTPLLKIEKVAGHLKHVSIYAKAEWFNPGGSVKDRPALYMIMDGIKKGLLTKDKIIIDATSGNTGIAYAMIGAVLGYRVKLAIPQNASPERKRILKAYGAELIFTNPLEGTDGAQKIVKEIVSLEPERYFYPDQYNNDANWLAHYETTAVEIINQTKRKITHFVAGLGTTGTFVGTAKRLKEFNPEIKTIAVQPDSPLHGIEGLKHLPTALVPGIYKPELVDEMIEVSTEEAYEMVKRLARDEGLLVGVSSGAVMVACLKIAEKIENGVIVTVFPDSGLKYLSEKFWDETNFEYENDPSDGGNNFRNKIAR
ncbi:PLP-dependent cysteine synthase family protein [Candidatus Chrysopegis kryptomonas]|uniref:cysteine synthase n=1 Tax=Candidatus Chryseopegocella kryptomonas TaxID=1633643 RepID=A0A0N7MYU6_9BACT|nr:cysteine synthase family protein [Candidatus Chrysopegis kryptomonas]CUT05227.1 cysteine synthase [Candidatus Chrysopegis kryptomonas]